MDLRYDLPFLFIVFSLLAAFVMPFFARWKKELCAPLTIFATGSSFVVSIIFVIFVLEGGELTYGVGGWDPPYGIEIMVDSLTSVMLLLVTGVSFLISIFSLRSVRKEVGDEARGWYYVQFLLCMIAMVGLVISRDMFNIYVYIEIVGISACALVVSKGDRIATEATLKYLLLATIGSGFILLGIGFIYMITGHLNLIYAGEALKLVSGDYPFLLWVTMSFFVVGFGIKAALFPLHLWLPDAHSSAPSGSSAMLSSLVVKVYIVSLFKMIFIVFGLEMFEDTTNIKMLILVMAAAAILGGSFFAFVQLELKRRLAYSTVAQVGYIFLGIGLGTPEGMLAAFFHIIVHAFMKTVLFLCAGAIYYQTGRKKVTQFAGLGYTMPITMGAFLIASFSMVGIPATGGFISKFYLGLGSLAAGYPIFILLIVVSGLLNAMYYFPILWQAYFVSDSSNSGDEGSDDHDHGHGSSAPKFKLDKVPVTMLAPIVILALGVIFLGLFFNYSFELLQMIVDKYLMFGY